MSIRSTLKLTLDDGAVIVLPVGSDRGVSQSMRPIDGAVETRRSVNGDMIVLENPLFRKYSTSISARDMETPALGGVWTGALVDVDCVARFRERLLPDGSATLSRDPVPGSVELYGPTGVRLTPSVAGRAVSGGVAGGWAIYRPILSCVILGVSWEDEEMAAAASWSIDLEEV